MLFNPVLFYWDIELALLIGRAGWLLKVAAAVTGNNCCCGLAEYNV